MSTPDPREAARRSRAERIRQRRAALQARADHLQNRAQEARSTNSAVDALFEIADRDAEVAGGIIAGALAFRLFIWLLPFGLVFVGGLGVAASAESDTPKGVAGHLGIGGLVAGSLQSASKSHSSWYALIIGIPLLLYATRSVLRVLIGTHRLAWGEVRAAQPKPKLAATAKLLGLIIVLFFLAGVAAWARARSPAAGLVVTILVVVGFAGIWLVVSDLLPHRDAGWVDLLPGSVAFGIGAAVMQVLAAYLLGPYALEKEGTYGALGLAAAMLLGLFFLGRLMIGAAEINATLFERKRRNG